MAQLIPVKLIVYMLSVFGGLLLMDFWTSTHGGSDNIDILHWKYFDEDESVDRRECGAKQYVFRKGPTSKSSQSALLEEAIQVGETCRRAMLRRLDAAVNTRLRKAKQYAKTRTALTSTAPPSNLFVTFVAGSGRLGNFMFMLASTIGIARATGRTAALQFPDSRTSFFFGLDLPTMDEINRTSTATKMQSVTDIAAGIYTQDLLQLNRNFSGENVTLHGYLQSWKYFHHIRDEIRTKLTFKERILRAAQKGITRLLQGLSAQRWSGMKRPLLAGVHVRRGDIVTTASEENGYAPATIEYLRRMVDLVERKHAPVVFIVVSDDKKYCRKNFKAINILCAKENRPEVDMAVLSLMEVVILSVGTFGWWGAYLSDAKDVYYYKDWPRNGTRLQREVVHNDYFLSCWQGEN